MGFTHTDICQDFINCSTSWQSLPGLILLPRDYPGDSDSFILSQSGGFHSWSSCPNVWPGEGPDFSSVFGAPYKRPSPHGHLKLLGPPTGIKAAPSGAFLLIPNTWEDGRRMQLLRIHHDTVISHYFKL